jgi:hypothetical protein
MTEQALRRLSDRLRERRGSVTGSCGVAKLVAPIMPRVAASADEPSRQRDTSEREAA